MRALIVHAHHESRSFCSALSQKAATALAESGYDVDVSDLYAMNWNPVSNRANFSTVLNPSYLKQQAEEQHASVEVGFASEVEAEIRKLETCDLLIFSFPLWWYGMPAILKGWVDRVFAMGRIYGGGKYYENGLGKAKKRAMVILTTGGGAVSFSGKGTNLSLDNVLKPIEHGVFWFNGFLPLDPFVAWDPARISHEERGQFLAQLDARFRRLHCENARKLPLRSDFGVDGTDKKKRFMVQVNHHGSSGHQDRLLGSQLEELKRSGVLLASHFGISGSSCWNSFLIFRETDLGLVRQHLATLPLASDDLDISELAV
jgi:NAD(P)H dehydrogenase (quinone)